MSLLRRIKFAVKYDVQPGFIVVPFGEQLNPTRFVRYEDAAAFAENEVVGKPQYPKPEILVVVSR